MNEMHLGKNIITVCKERKITLSRLAKDAGVPVQTLHGWTSGRKAVQLEQLKRVADVLAISVHELAFGVPDPHSIFGEEVLKELFSGDIRVTVQKIERRK